jgi:hypothetical protein
MSAHDCPWGPYRHTTLVVGDDVGVVRVDLSRPVDDDARARLARALGPAFAIITAYNPYSLARGAASEADNHAAHERLRAAILSRGLAHREADGHANDAPGHVERGFAVQCDDRTACALACEFGQDAYFDYDGEAFWIRPALLRTVPAVRLGG